MLKSLFSFLKSLRKRRRPFKLTKGGWIFILYTVGVGAGAINTGNNLLYLLFGLFLGVILASGFLSDFSLWGLSAEMILSAPGRAGRVDTLPFTVKNTKGRIPAVSLTVELLADLQGQPLGLKKFIPVVFHGEQVSSYFSFRSGRRGLLKPRQVRFVTRFPFGLFVKWWTHDLVDSDDDRSLVQAGHAGMIIHPSRLNAEGESHRPGWDGREAMTASKLKGEGAAVFGLRDFREEDNPRRIHWKASARRGVNSEGDLRLFIRELEADQQPEAALVWPSLKAISVLESGDKELMIRFTASLAILFKEEGREPALFIRGEEERDSRRVTSPGLNGVLDFISVFDDPGMDVSALSSLTRPLPEESFPETSADILDLFQKWKTGGLRRARVD